jgi:hypothetical protein
MAASETTPDSSPGNRLQPVVDPRLETPRAAGVAGLVLAALFVASILLLRNQPSTGTTAAEIRASTSASTPAVSRSSASISCRSPGPPSCGSSRRSGTSSATARIGSSREPGERRGHPLARVRVPLHLRHADGAVFMIVASTIGMRLGVFPRWLVVTGYLAALVPILNVSYTETLILAFPL